MGHGRRTVPEKMPEKLQSIRLSLKLGLEDMVRSLSEKLSDLKYSDVKIYRGHIREFEQGKREPSLPVLLAYARIAEVSVDSLIDNEIVLTSAPDGTKKLILENAAEVKTIKNDS